MACWRGWKRGGAESGSQRPGAQTSGAGWGGRTVLWAFLEEACGPVERAPCCSGSWVAGILSPSSPSLAVTCSCDSAQVKGISVHPACV